MLLINVTIEKCFYYGIKSDITIEDLGYILNPSYTCVIDLGSDLLLQIAIRGRCTHLYKK